MGGLGSVHTDGREAINMADLLEGSHAVLHYPALVLRYS